MYRHYLKWGIIVGEIPGKVFVVHEIARKVFNCPQSSRVKAGRSKNNDGKPLFVWGIRGWPHLNLTHSEPLHGWCTCECTGRYGLI